MIKAVEFLPEVSGVQCRNNSTVQSIWIEDLKFSSQILWIFMRTRTSKEKRVIDMTSSPPFPNSQVSMGKVSLWLLLIRTWHCVLVCLSLVLKGQLEYINEWIKASLKNWICSRWSSLFPYEAWVPAVPNRCDMRPLASISSRIKKWKTKNEKWKFENFDGVWVSRYKTVMYFHLYRTISTFAYIQKGVHWRQFQTCTEI